MQEDIVYQEKVKSNPLILAFLGLSVIGILVVGLILYFSQNGAIEKNVLPTVAIVLFVDVLLLLVFTQMQIVVTEKKLQFGFLFFRKKIKINEIVKLEVSEYKFSNYFGYGIRFGRDNTIGYVPSGGRGIKVTSENDKRAYFFICTQPEQVLAILKQYGAKK